MRAAKTVLVDRIIVGQSRHGRWYGLLRGSVVHKLLRQAGDVDVHVVADREER